MNRGTQRARVRINGERRDEPALVKLAREWESIRESEWRVCYG